MTCRRCAGATGPESFLPTGGIEERVDAIVASWDTGPGPNIAYFGAEPFRHPELPQLIKHAIDAGVERMCLVTDARAIAHADNAVGAVSAGVRHVQSRLLGATAETHDQLIGSPGAFAQTHAGLKALSAAGEQLGVPVLVCGRVSVCSHNVKELPGIVLAFADTGASSVTFEFDGSVPRTVARPWVSAAIETGIVNGVWVDLEGMSAEELHVHPLHNTLTVNVIDLPLEASA